MSSDAILYATFDKVAHPDGGDVLVLADALGRLVVVDAFSMPGTVPARVQFPQSVVAAVFAAADPTRTLLIVVNDAPAFLYLGYGAVGVTPGDYTYKLRMNDIAIIPASEWQGEVQGVWAAGPGAGLAAVTILTP